MNILVTGCKGQLGTELQKIAARDKQHQWMFTDVDTLDICNKTAVEACFDEHHIEACINCAAYTAVDKAEDERMTPSTHSRSMAAPRPKESASSGKVVATT